MAKWPYCRPWPTVRIAILERDHYACQIRGPGCTTKATQVDHIQPWAEGGAPYDPNNLRASCAHCNHARAVGRRAALATVNLQAGIREIF